jgi:hypothetical protein
MVLKWAWIYIRITQYLLSSAKRKTRQTLWAKLAQAMIEDLVEDANNATEKDWSSANQNPKVQIRNSTNFSGCSGTCTFNLAPIKVATPKGSFLSCAILVSLALFLAT